jgi:tRNA dimethylallyltransferase
VHHHLVDVVEPDERYDAARFAREAAAAIASVRERARWPVLVGGTGLYYRALVRGLLPRPPADPDLRRRLRAEVTAEGPLAMHRRLATVDPASAAALHPSDALRVTRALEVVLQTGRPAVRRGAGDWEEAPPDRRYRVVTVGLNAPRPALHAALDVRVDRMLADGLLEEVGALVGAGFDPALPAMQGIGYRHLAPVVARRSELGGAVAAMKRDTRRYAKRQVTWFSREPGLSWVETDPTDIAAALLETKKIVERTRLFA